MLALFRRRILGKYPAAPCSPGPLVLLLIDNVTGGNLKYCLFGGVPLFL